MCRTTKFKLHEQKELKKDNMFGCNFCFEVKDLSNKHKLGNKCLDCFEKLKPKKEERVLPTEKVCVTCEQLLPINKFPPSYRNKTTGWVTYHKSCYKCRYKKNKEYTNEYGKKYRKSMTIEQKEKYQSLKSLKFRSREQKDFRKEGKFGCNICGEVKLLSEKNERQNTCKPCYNSQRRDWYSKNKDATWRTTYKWLKKKKSEDPFYRLVYNMRYRLWYEFKKINVEKDDSILDFLGITVGEFKLYIESKFKEGMTWDNYGIDGWHLDHIIPISSAKTKKDLEELSHYTNLQPLWAEENMKKGDKIL